MEAIGFGLIFWRSFKKMAKPQLRHFFNRSHGLEPRFCFLSSKFWVPLQSPQHGFQPMRLRRLNRFRFKRGGGAAHKITSLFIFDWLVWVVYSAASHFLQDMLARILIGYAWPTYTYVSGVERRALLQQTSGNSAPAAFSTNISDTEHERECPVPK